MLNELWIALMDEGRTFFGAACGAVLLLLLAVLLLGVGYSVVVVVVGVVRLLPLLM